MYNEITVVIVTFNSDYAVLNRCINSIEDNIQIIIVDNSSNLESQNIENYKTKKIKIIKNENTGNGDGINIGVDNCNSKYVLYLDVDTQLPEKFFSKMFDYVNKIKDFLMQNKKKAIIILPLMQQRPLFYNKKMLQILDKINIDKILIGHIIPPFGFIPHQLTDIYPISQMEISENMHNESNTIKQTIKFIEMQFKIINPKYVYLVKNELVDDKITKFIMNKYSPKRILEDIEEITNENFDM